jgi:ligand-binding sensor domain-containing protein
MAQGLFNDVIMKILEDNYGNLWLGSMKGIGCVNKQMLDDFTSKRLTAFSALRIVLLMV